MAEVNWAEPALEQLREITEYLDEHSPNAALDLHARVHQATQLLGTSPRMGRVVPEFKIEHFREVIVKPYRVMYVVQDDPDTCIIVAVVHGRRDVASLIRPEDLGA
jgi:plasmid stabilization system protein ParE